MRLFYRPSPDAGRWRPVLLLVCVGLCSAPASAAKNSLSAAMESLTADDLYHDVEVLADDVYEGRAAGSRGGHAAARYLIQQLRPLHLTPGTSDGDYVQTFGDDCRNILAMQQGDDDNLKDEVIIVGAHYDHVGYGNSRNSFGPFGRIHNGADDNASGTSVLLEIIKAMSRFGLTTRRSIIFAFWDAEERGLLGSRHWLSHPTVPIDRVKFNITMDMVGRLRNERLLVLGSRSGYGTRRLFSNPVDDKLSLDFSWDLSANSDHWPFVEKRIPIVLLHTGLHSDYHRPTDDVDKINSRGMGEVSRYLLAALMRVANEDRLPKFRDAVRRENDSMRRSLEQPLPATSLEALRADQRPKLGISWREDEAEPGSVFVVRIVKHTPAEAAGLETGDRIDELDGRPFENATAFQQEIHALLESTRSEFDMLVERRGHMRTISVKMPSTSNEAGGESTD